VKGGAKDRIVSQFNNMVGTHQIGATYQFNKSQHFIIEGAQRILAAGSTTIKFALARKELASLGITPSTPFPSFLAFVTDPKLPWLHLLDMPFSTFQFWYDQKWGNSSNSSKVSDPYQQTYDVATYLLKRYNNTGKTFMFSEWLADTQLYYPPANSVPINRQKYPYLLQPLDTTRLQLIINRFSLQQKAIDDAKRDLEAKVQNVFVWFNVEVNMLPTPAHPSISSHAIPKMQPPPDFVSFSTSTSPELTDSLPLMAKRMSTALTTVNSFIPPKPTVPGVRTLSILEFPTLEYNGSASYPTSNETLQARYALWQMACTIAWGSPHNMWWTFYDNTATNTIPSKPQGFHLVTPENKDTVLYKALQEYWRASRRFVGGWVESKGKAPGDFAFRKWAVGKLAELSGVTGLPKPTVKDQGC